MIRKLFGLTLLVGIVYCVGVAHATQPVVVDKYGIVYRSFGADGGATTHQINRQIELAEEQLAEQRETNRLLRLMADKLGVPAPAAAPPKPLDLLTVAQRHCVQCHTPGKADRVGGGFIMFNDDKGTALQQFNTATKNRMKQMVEYGTMPKGGKKLTGPELAAFPSK